MAKLRRASLKSDATPKQSENMLATKDNYLQFVISGGESYSNRGDYIRNIHVWRILFESVPIVLFDRKTTELKIKPPTTSFKPERLGFMVSVYKWLSTFKNTATAAAYMGAITYFVKFCEKQNLPVEISERVINEYSNYLLLLSRQADTKLGTLQIYSSYLKLFIKWQGEDELADKLITVSKKSNLEDSTAPYEPKEVQELAKDLFSVYNKLALAYIQGTEPVCPFEQPYPNWDVHPAQNSTAWLTKLVIAGYMITEMFTGDNSTPLLTLKRESIDLKEVKLDKINNIYKLKTKKGRSNHTFKPYELGFTKRGLDFFFSLISISQRLDPSPDAYLFPYIKHGKPSGRIKDAHINTFCRWFESRTTGGIAPVPRRFRKTKAESLMGITNCYFVVAEGLNNNVGTVERSYSDGSPANNDLSLSAGVEALIMNAQGHSIDTARALLEKKYGTILTVREAELSDIRLANTDVGLKCKSPFGEKAERLKSGLIKSGLADEKDDVACFKFLDCFECEHQAFVADIEDVWCLLSFRDSILEAINNPSVNHTLTEKARTVLIRVQNALLDMQDQHPAIYAEAEDKNSQAPHPIWDDELALGDLYTIW